MRFSKSTGSFYPPEFQYTNLPSDIIEVPQEDFDWAMNRGPGDTLDVINGRVVILPPPPPTVTEIIATYTAAIQKRLDDFARTRNYDGILSAATYATSQVAKFKAEGQYAVEARGATWAKCYEVLAAVESGSRPMPTLDELLAELPTLTWPN